MTKGVELPGRIVDVGEELWLGFPAAHDLLH